MLAEATGARTVPVPSASVAAWRHPTGLAPAPTRILLLRGEDKRQVYERALAGDDAHELPVRIAIDTPGATLDVYWCP